MVPAPGVTTYALEFLPADIQVVTDPSLPAGQVVLTGSRGLWQFVLQQEPRDGDRVLADVAAFIRYVEGRYGPLCLPDWSTGDVTSSQRNAGTDSGSLPDSVPGRQYEAGDIPWSDPMQWSPGDAEW